MVIWDFRRKVLNVCVRMYVRSIDWLGWICEDALHGQCIYYAFLMRFVYIYGFLLAFVCYFLLVVGIYIIIGKMFYSRPHLAIREIWGTVYSLAVHYLFIDWLTDWLLGIWLLDWILVYLIIRPMSSFKVRFYYNKWLTRVNSLRYGDSPSGKQRLKSRQIVEKIAKNLLGRVRIKDRFRRRSDGNAPRWVIIVNREVSLFFQGLLYSDNESRESIR